MKHQMHGGYKTELYGKWCSMKNRCNCPTNKQYKDYGGRGIRVCEEWEHDFAAFRDWALNNGYSEDLQIDRIDNDEGYSPTNCRFVTPAENMRNRRNNVYFVYMGNRVTMKDLSKITGIPYRRIRNRKDLGWSIEEILKYPNPHVKGKRII